MTNTPWKTGHRVEVDYATKYDAKTDKFTYEKRIGTVRYVYTNGYTLVAFRGDEIKGGLLNNNSTFKNDKIKKIEGAAK